MIYQIATRDDAENINNMRNHLDVRQYLHSPICHTLKNCTEWIENIYHSSSSERIAIYTDPPETETLSYNPFVGLFRIDEIDALNNTCYVGLDINPSQQGKGYASIIYKHMLNELFELRNMRIIYLEVLSHNETAIHIYKKLGFMECGRFPRKIVRFGREIDSCVMYIDRKMLIQNE